jgi:glycosyltransferase involved in cell wall biosynthesis
VDVIIPSYNKGDFLAEAIASALGQTYPHVGVIVVDDGSTDHSAEVAQRYGDRICYLRKENAGVSAARNTGILEARGDFVLFLDADDYLRPDMLERLMEAARAMPAGSVFHGSSQRVDISGRAIRPVEKEPLPADVFHSLLGGNSFPIHSAVVRRTAFARAGLFDVSLGWSEDWDMWIRLAASGCAFVPVPDAVAIYRVYPASRSHRFDGTWQTGLAVLQKSQTYHGRTCALCRRALARGREGLRRFCIDPLVHELYVSKARGGVPALIARAAREMLRDPVLATYALWALARCPRGARARRRPPIAVENPR